MSKQSWLSSKFAIVITWIMALAIRIYGTSIPAQYYDMGTFEAWSRSFWVYGPVAFFSSVWSDYLPLPILSFAPISLLADFFHLSFSITFKIVHILMEFILIFFITRSIIPKLKYVVVILLLLSPVLIGDGSFWGQVDAIPSLLAVLSLVLITPGVKGAHTPGVFVPGFIFGLAVAYKPIMVLVAPVIWIASIKKGISWWKFPVISSTVFFLTAIPTGGWSFVQHVFSRIFDQAGTYPYLTINAFNFWSLVPNPSWLPDTTTILGLSGRTLGLVLFLSFSLVVFNSWRNSSFSGVFSPRVAATILILFYTFTTRMHERHLLFGLPFLMVASAYESWLLIPLSLLTLTFSLNLYGAYFWVGHGQSWPFSTIIISILSWITVLTSLGLALIWSWPKFLRSTIYHLQSHKILVSILLLATILRFGNLSYPSTYIFDEVYHAFTAREYIHGNVEAWEWWTTPPEGVAFEWTHPPVAKYGMVAGMLLFGENSFGWRVGSAIFGVISILGLYLLVFEITKNKQVALLSAFLVSIEGLHISQSRIAMNDMYMLCFYIWSLYLAVKSRWKGAAILYGLSLGSKWSALYGVIPLAVLYVHEYLSTYHDVRSIIYNLFSVLRLLLITVFIYILTFTPFILAGHTWAQWWELHRQMWYYHTHLVATHGYQSTPLQWIFDARPVWYFVSYLEKSISNIYAHGNPLILWFGLVAIIMQLKKMLKFNYSIFLILYLIFTLPWIISPRIMFFYHYLPSSVFLCVILASWLRELPKKYMYLIVLLTVCSLLIISPMIYGFPMPHLYWDTLFKLIPSWK